MSDEEHPQAAALMKLEENAPGILAEVNQVMRGIVAQPPDPVMPVSRGYVAKIDGFYIAWSKDPRQLERVRKVRSPREAEPFPNQVEAVKAAGPTEIVTVEPAPERLGCPCYAEALATAVAHVREGADAEALGGLLAALYGVAYDVVRDDMQDANALPA